MKAYLCILAVFTLFTFPAVAQQALQGEVNYENLGIRFNIPQGWQGQEVEQGVLLVSQTHAGLILITTNTAKSLEEIRQQGTTMVDFGEGSQFSPKGALQPVGSNGLAGPFEGSFEYQPARAFIGGLFNAQGMGLSVIAVTSPEAYGAIHESSVLSLMKSVVFSKAKESNALQEWRDYISNARLTYMDSYYSGGDISGGYSTEIAIDICARGFFRYSGKDEMTVGGAGSSGWSQSGSEGNGTWQVMQAADGSAVLVLKFYSGEEYNYTLSYEDSKTYLNGQRYFVTREGEYAPNCY